MQVTALELRGPRDEPVSRELVVGVELRKFPVLEQEIVTEPQVDTVPDEQLALLR